MIPRPRVTLKLATSLDGRIATAAGESRWITGDLARTAVHRLRAKHDAILVGIDTVLADDPELTVRLPEFVGAKPARVVLDSHQRLPLTSKLAATAQTTPTYVVTLDEPNPSLIAAGVRVLQVSASGERPDLHHVMECLSKVRIYTLFVEGGGQVAASFLSHGFVDALEWFRAPILLGAEGRPAIGALGLDALVAAPTFVRKSVELVGPDIWERYEMQTGVRQATMSPTPDLGDTARIADTSLMRAMGFACQTGMVLGWTTPSSTGVEPVGDDASDRAICVEIDGEGRWFAPSLVTFVDHGPGTTAEVAGRRFVRTADGGWTEEIRHKWRLRDWLNRTGSSTSKAKT